MISLRERLDLSREFVRRHGPEASRLLIISGCVVRGRHELSGGLISPLKVDIDNLREGSREEAQLQNLLYDYARSLRIDANQMVGVIKGGARFVEGVAGEVWFGSEDRFAARMGKKTGPEEQTLVLGDIKPKSKVWLLEDVVTQGTNSRIVAETVRKEGATVDGILTIYSHYLVGHVDGIIVWPLCNFFDLMNSLPYDPKLAPYRGEFEEWHARGAKLVRL